RTRRLATSWSPKPDGWPFQSSRSTPRLSSASTGGGYSGSWDSLMPRGRCPDCGALIELAEGTRAGDGGAGPNCAGHALRVRDDAGRWSAALAYRVSCPTCDEVLTLPDDVTPGDTIRCCGRTYRLTFEYGAYAAEEA